MGAENLLTPKFLTKEMAEFAVHAVLNTVFKDPTFKKLGIKRPACHIVVMVPGMKDDRAADYPNWPDYELKPVSLYEHSRNKKNWTAKYDDIARCKALQLWHGRNNGGMGSSSHLLFPGDTPFWGGVNREGIVVTCSGVQSWFDRMIAGMIADMLIAWAHEQLTTSQDMKDEVAFLT